MSRRQLSAVCFSVLLLFAWVRPASAPALSLRLHPRAGPPTSPVRVSGHGFSPAEQVAIAFDREPRAIVTADSSGSFLATIEVPSSARPGRRPVQAHGLSSDLRASAAFLVRTNWEQASFDPAHHGLNPYENVLGPSNVGGLAEAWQAPLGNATAYASPIVANGRVFVGDDAGVFHAFSVTTGADQWSVKAESFFLGSAAFADGLVFAVPVDGPLHAYHAATGLEAWSRSCPGGFRASPTTVGHVVYATCSNGTVYALDAATGSLRWTSSVGCCVFDQAPTVADGNLYQMSTNHTLTALDASDGSLVWSVPAFAVGTVSVGDGRVYFNDYPNVVAIDASTGKIIWQRPVLTLQPDGSPAVVGPLVYAESGALVALNAHTGATVWSADVENAWGPTVANGVVYAPSGTMDFVSSWELYRAETGEHLATIHTPAGSCFFGACARTLPVIADGTLYLAGPGPALHAFRLP
jgi:outer membrane protein assembly factor BamB